MKNRFILLTILLLALLLRLHNLDRYPLWYDEASSAMEERSIFSLPPISKFLDTEVSLARQDYLLLYNHFVVYYWKKFFGDSEINLRLSSVFFGILGLYVFYKLAEFMYNTKIAQVSSFLLAVSPFHIHYSQELRSYAAMCLFTLLAFFSLLKLIKEQKKIYWLTYALANIINIYFHYMMLIVLLAQIIFFVVSAKHSKISFFKVFAAHLAILIAVAPVILIIIPNLIFILTHQVDSNLTEFPVWAQRVNLKNILFTLKNFSAGYYIDYYSRAGITVTALYLFFFIMGLYKDGLKRTFMLTMLAFPVSLLFIISKFIKACYVDRYFFPIFPLYILGISNGVFAFKGRIKYFLFATGIIISLGGLHNYYLDRLPDKFPQHMGIVRKDNDIRKVAQFISDNFEDKDKIYCTSKLVVFPLKFYIRRLETERGSKNKTGLISEAGEGRLIWTDSQNNLMFLSCQNNRPTSKIVSDQNFKDASGRVWLIFSLYDPRPGILEKMGKILSVKEKYNFNNLELYLFIPENERL